jgi:hypothetical protein
LGAAGWFHEDVHGDGVFQVGRQGLEP